jgi:hypothetical protein
MVSQKTQKIKANEITLKDLVEEALSIPDGWKEEIYVENWYVEFTSPMTKNTWTAKADNPNEMLDSYVADLESVRLGDFEGIMPKEDGTYEVDGEILTEKEVIEAIAMNLQGEESIYNGILEKIQHPKAVFKDEAVRCERCGVEIWQDVDCACGIDGADHEGLAEAYEEKTKEIKR